MDGQTAGAFGLFESAIQAEEALDILTSEQFSSDDVSVLMRDAPGAHSAGGTLGLLAGLSTRAIPGSGRVISAGPIQTELAGLEDDFPGDGLAAIFKRSGISESQALRFSKRIKDGAVLLCVRCASSSNSARALDVLKRCGSDEFVSTSETTGDSQAAAM